MNDENKIPEWAPALEDLKLGSRVRWNESLKRSVSYTHLRAHET